MNKVNYIRVIRSKEDIKSVLMRILKNPDQEFAFDCSFEANPFWSSQEYSRHDPRPEQEKEAYWKEVDELNDRIVQKNVCAKVILGRYDLQNYSNAHLENRRSFLQKSYSEIICWPTRFFHDALIEQGHALENRYQDNYSNSLIASSRKLFVSHMHVPKIHRIALMEVLIDNNAMGKGTVRFCNNSSLWRRFVKLEDYREYLPAHKLAEFMEKLLPFAPEIFSPYKYTPNYPGDRGSCCDPHYRDGFIDISPETNHHINFITQKSCQAILWKKPFCIMGSLQQNTLLKNLGFELYDEIFDFSYETDKLENTNLHDYELTKDHYNKLLENLWNVDDSPESLRDMKQKFSPKAEHNLNRYMQILFNDDMIPEFQEIREGHEVVLSRDMALNNPYLKNYVPIDKRKDRK